MLKQEFNFRDRQSLELEFEGQFKYAFNEMTLTISILGKIEQKEKWGEVLLAPEVIYFVSILPLTSYF